MAFRDDYVKLDATAIAALVRARQVSAREVADTAIALVEAANPKLNAVVAERYEAARKDADAVEGEELLAGVPLLLKGNSLHIAGMPFMLGSRFFADEAPAPADSTLVAAWRKAGVIVLGKTNLPELATSFTTEPAHTGVTRNPWNLDRTTGGSSGGSAAAVAARLVPIGHANDGGGSIRVPASACGLFGLKPTENLVTLRPYFDRIWSGLDAEHVLTRSVRDSALFLDVALSVAECPRPQTERPYTAALSRPFRRLRIAATLDNPVGSPVAPEVADAHAETCRHLEALGHAVEPISLPHGEGGVEALLTLIAVAVAESVAVHADKIGRQPAEGDLEPANLALLEMGRAATAVDLARAQSVRAYHRAAVDALFATYDMILTPTLAVPPVPLGMIPGTGAFDLSAYLGRLFAFAPFTATFNLTGHPAMSVPLATSSEGLPIGMQFAAGAWAEDLLLQLAAELEIAHPWAERMPDFVTAAEAR